MTPKNAAMSLRNFAILCMLCVAGGTRADYEEDEFSQEAETSFNEVHSDQHLFKCAEDQLPTAADNEFCAVFGGDGEACRGNGCRSLDKGDLLGRLTCEGQCNEGSAAQDNVGLSVPNAVKDAVRKAKELAVATFDAATAKVDAARQAETLAMQNKEELLRVAANAAMLLEKAQDAEKGEQEAKVKMEIALATAASADAEMQQLSQDSNAAVAVKAEKLALMNQALKAKQDKEAEWKTQEKLQKTEYEDLKGKIPMLEAQLEARLIRLEALKREVAKLEALKREVAALQQQIPEAKTRMQQASDERSRLATLRRKGEGWDLRQEYKKINEDYIAAKNKVQELNEAAKISKASNKDASSKGQLALAAYLQQVASSEAASAQKTEAEKKSDLAEVAAREAHLMSGVMSRNMAQALKNKADAVALTAQVRAVYKYAAEFYDKLDLVSQPTGDNEMMRLAQLSSDPSMKACLSSYNVVITEANRLAESNAEPTILAELKAGLTQIKQDRFTRFKSWCGKDGELNVAKWIWGANGLTENELVI